MNMKVLIATSLVLVGCEDHPRTAAGGVVGAAAGGAGALGISKALGASNGLAAALGVMGAAAGGAVGAKLGSNFDKQAKKNAIKAAKTHRPVSWQNDKDEEFVALPSNKRNEKGDSVRVKIINKKTGKEVIVDMDD